jgi:hypothetical protein
MIVSTPQMYTPLSISLQMQFWFVAVIPKFLNFARYSKDLLTVSILQVWPTRPASETAL